MTTSDLLKRYQASTDEGEKFYLEQELRGRSVSVDVQVDATEDDYLGDEVFVALSSAGGGSTSSSIKWGLKAGAGYTFTLPLAEIWPVSGNITVNVFEWDLIGNDLIGTITWPPPYVALGGVAMSYRTALYRVSVSM